MPPYLTLILTFLAGAAALGLFLRIVMIRRFRFLQKEAEDQAERTLEEAQLEVKRMRMQAELDIERLQSERDSLWRQRDADLETREKVLRARSESIKASEALLEERQEAFSEREAELKDKRQEAEKYSRLYRMRLHSMLDWDEERIRKALMETVRHEAETEVQQIRTEILGRTEAEVEEHARKVLLSAMQRIASNPAHDASATVVKLETEDMKGRIIGREGRNIRSFESVTGTTLMIDESPDSVLVSSFDPVRREVARLALERLMKDGRINPATIEDTVQACEQEMDKSIQEWGEKALRQLRLHAVAPEVVDLLGKLHYRLSNNQNTLDHSIEVAFISSLLAAELGLDQVLAKRAGLFHDMGKSVSHEYEGSHAAVAADILKRYGEDWRVINAVAAHHEEVPDESVYAGILKVADSLSAMRPGARTDSMDSYLRRVKSLETVALSFKGVQEAYAIQAGREVRVIVSPDDVNDRDARQLARNLRQRIEDEISFPGTIKITVVRERRFHETAK